MQIFIVTLLSSLLLCTVTASAATLTLGECLQMAASGSRALKTAAYDERLAAEQVRTATSGYLPRIDLQGGYVAQMKPQAVKFGTGAPVETQEPDFAFFNLSLYETLYDFGRTSARKEQATLLKEATGQDYRAREQDTFMQVVSAYYGILEAQRNLRAADDESAQMKNHLNMAKSLYEQGVVTRNDLLQAEVRLAASQQKRFSMANAVENGWLALNYLSGRPGDARGELVEDGGVDSFRTDRPAGAADFSGRGEVVALRKAIAAGDMAVKESRSAYYPEIFAKLSMDYVQNDKVREQAIYAATVGLKVNLFDGLATTSRLQQAVIQRSRNEERLRDLEARLAMELQSATNDMKVSVARIALTESAIRQAEENLRINRDKYQEQVGTATAVIDAQTLLTQTRTDYYRALFDFQVAAARVKRATGEL